ncbi:MAG: type I DNA topoisomerase [Acidimicrobiia bacterium]|nr:type I DNA topoisomerase [Acidimicrobiia bacterium]
MAKPLIIVESPAKARTIAGYLGSEYEVTSSVGHIRDLPRSASEIPPKYKGEPWAKDWGINISHEFEPLYIVPKEKKDTVKNLKSLLSGASEVYLATDEDREGEAIAWHLTQVLKPKVPVQRMVFHEITPDAIRHAIDHPREIDGDLVDAQEARRTLDRLVGYGVSPVLWRKVKPRLSAGRVQSVAVRVIVERERERIAFVAAGYWDLEGIFATEDDTFSARLVTLDGRRVATGKDFDDDGRLQTADVTVLDEIAAAQLATELDSVECSVRSVERKPYTRNPYPPFRTSTLQQEASRKFRFGAARTMSAAQRLYENGYITYMRTDSTSLSEVALATSRAQITELYGSEYLSSKAKQYANKVKNAQEAHEAIRPAGDTWKTPEVAAAELQDTDQVKVYELIWTRTLASQMAPARGESVSVRVGGTATSGRDAEFATSGKTITFPGFLRVYVQGSDDPEADLDDQERRLPAMAAGDPLTLADIEAKGHETKPPSRFTEASLVKRLEELGIGRPSTYASIIQTIINRGYIWKRGTALVPSFTAFATITLLEQHFPNLVDYAFTAKMENDLDRIARGEEARVPWLDRFFNGNGQPGLKDMVSQDRLDEIDAREINSIPIGADENGEVIVARVGRYGPYVARGEDTVSIPEDLPPDELTAEMAVELLNMPSGDKILGSDPDSGLTVLARNGRFGPYVQLGELEEGSKVKPKTASLFKSMTLDELSLDQALKLLTLPRAVGTHPDTEQEIIAANGRYGPYIKMDKDTRSLESEDQIFTITQQEAIELLAQPKRRRGRAASQPPLRELGKDPDSGGDVVVKDGRFGLYVTDGIVNASLQKADSIDGITLERAADLLEARRDRMKSKGQWPPKKT